MSSILDHMPDTPRRSTNKWSYEQRLCLDVLWTAQQTKISLEDRARIFNTIFQDHLAACGNPDGLRTAAISAQYAERHGTHKPSWSAKWERICAVPKLDVTLREQLQKKIDAVLQNANSDAIKVGPGPGPGPVATPPSTPRRPGHIRKAVENSYDIVTPGPKTPVWAQRHLEYIQEPPVLNLYATPRSSSRKRPAEAHQYEVGDTDTEDAYEPRAKKIRKSSPAVIIPPTPSRLVTHQPQQALPRTPKRRPGEPRVGATMRYVQPSGRELMLKPKEHDEASRPLKDVTEEAAHPYPPAMLFRFWHNKSHGINSSNGFVAGKFVPQRILVEPRGPPDCNAIDMNDIAHHLNNRTGTDQDGFPSPFISTTNNLSWSVRMALKRMDLDAKLSIIDASSLDPKAIYWVPPFYEQLKKKRCFERGYFGYKGTHEHLVYHKVPRPAMVNTFSVQELIKFANGDKDVKRVLRLDVMAVAKTPAIEVMKALKQSNLEVNSKVASAVGKIVLFLGLDHNSSREILSRAVFEVLQGWAIKADGRSQEKTNAFVKQFQDKSADYIDISDQLKLKHAFLHGMLWSCGDLNVHLKGRAGHELMQLRASKRGLIDPETLLLTELNEAMREITMCERQQFELHVGPAHQLHPTGQQASADVDDDDDAAEAENLMPTRLGRLELQERIVYE